VGMGAGDGVVVCVGGQGCVGCGIGCGVGCGVEELVEGCVVEGREVGRGLGCGVHGRIGERIVGCGVGGREVEPVRTLTLIDTSLTI
jgi:hypothetical protein